MLEVVREYVFICGHIQAEIIASLEVVVIRCDARILLFDVLQELIRPSFEKPP